MLLVLVAATLLVAPAWAERSALGARTAGFDAPRSTIDPATARSSRVLLDAGSTSLLALHNFGDGPRAVTVAVIDSTTDHFRQSQIVLAAGDHHALSLGTADAATWLHVVADGPVDAVLETLDAVITRPLELTSRAATGTLPLKSSTSCLGSWNLSCISPAGCTYVSGYKPGQLVDGDQVYWNLHYPIGSLVTTNGWCFTYWTLSALSGCPTIAYNCLGETYRVDTVERTVDLDMQMFNLSTFSLPSGGFLNASWRVENFGNSYASPTGLDECLYLSPTNRIDGNETLLVRTPKQPSGLAPGAGYDRQVSTQVNAAPGTYWMIVVADCDDAFGEPNRDNNAAYASGFTVN